MARTWALFDTPIVRDTQILNTNGHIGIGAGIIYFYATNGQGVYSWDGTNTVDLDPLDFFAGLSLRVVDIAVFQGSVFVLAGATSGAGNATVYKWTGSVWSSVLVVTDNDGHNCGVGNPPDAFQSFLDADDSNLIVWLGAAAGFSPEPETLGIWITSNGSSFTHMIEDSPDPDFPGKLSQSLVKGLNKHCTYPTVLNDSDSSQHGPTTYAGSTVTRVNPTQVDIRYSGLCGYSNTVGKMWGRKSSVDGTIVYSSDFVTYTNTGISGSFSGKPGFIVRDIESTVAIMGCFRNDDQAYVWNNSTNDFDADGTTSGETIRAFFRLGDKLYALCESTPGTVSIYQANDTLPAMGGGPNRLWMYKFDGDNWSSRGIKT